MPTENGFIVKLMYNSSTFADRTVTSTTVGALRTELDLPHGVTVNVDSVVANDSTEVKEGSFIAIVASNKTGG